MEKKNAKALSEISLESEFMYCLQVLTTINQWDSEKISIYRMSIELLVSQIKLMDRPLETVTDMSTTEREWLVDLLTLGDISVEDTLTCIELFNAISSLLRPNQLQTLNLRPSHIDFFQLKQFPFLCDKFR
jgi:hypothetical protein